MVRLADWLRTEKISCELFQDLMPMFSLTSGAYRNSCSGSSLWLGTQRSSQKSSARLLFGSSSLENLYRFATMAAHRAAPIHFSQDLALQNMGA